MAYEEFSDEAAFFAAELEVILQSTSPGLATAVAPFETAPTIDELDRQYQRLRADQRQAQSLATAKNAPPLGIDRAARTSRKVPPDSEAVAHRKQVSGSSTADP